MGYLLVGIGGMLGSISRYAVGRYISAHTKTAFPIGTFIINILGALLLGIVASFQSFNNIYLLLGDGFLGAFTTFSTFMFEGVNMFETREGARAIKYILCSLILGILGFVLGSKIGYSIK